MPYNGSGSFTLSQSAFVAGTVISSSAMNSDLLDIATNGLSKAIVVDGQNPITGQLRFPNGTAASPSHSFGSDFTTGMYYVGSKILGFASGGVASVSLNLNNQGSGQSGNVLTYNSPSGTVVPCPVGTLVDFAGTTAPAGWLLCFGQVLNISSYPELASLLGSAYGGNGSTTFGIPDCRGRTGYGQDNMGGVAAGRITSATNFDGTVLGNSGGSQNHTLSIAEMASHNHTGSGNVTDPGHAHTLNNSTVLQGGAGGNEFNVNGQSVNTTVNSNNTGITVSLNINNTGSGNSHTILGPGIIVNKMIFAGRQ